VRQDFEGALAERAVLRAKLGFAPDEFVFLMVGEMLPFRGVLRLVKAFAGLGRPSTGLLLVGVAARLDACAKWYAAQTSTSASLNR